MLFFARVNLDLAIVFKDHQSVQIQYLVNLQ